MADSGAKKLSPAMSEEPAAGPTNKQDGNDDPNL